jgi:hypothetical protein
MYGCHTGNDVLFCIPKVILLVSVVDSEAQHRHDTHSGTSISSKGPHHAVIRQPHVYQQTYLSPLELSVKRLLQIDHVEPRCGSGGDALHPHFTIHRPLSGLIKILIS